MKILTAPIYAGSLTLLLLLSLSNLVSSVRGQAQKGNNNNDISSQAGDDGQSGIHNGYYSYVADMDSADSVRQAMETVSWASVGSSWMVVQATEGVESEAQVQATPSSSPSLAAVGAIATEPASTPTPAASLSSSSSSNNNKNLAIGLGVGIPLALLSILSIVGVFIYKKRKATKRDFEKRTANLRNMTQTDV